MEWVFAHRLGIGVFTLVAWLAYGVFAVLAPTTATALAVGMIPATLILALLVEVCVLKR